jgi:hypothetical protein
MRKGERKESWSLTSGGGPPGGGGGGGVGGGGGGGRVAAPRTPPQTNRGRATARALHVATSLNICSLERYVNWAR